MKKAKIPTTVPYWKCEPTDDSYYARNGWIKEGSMIRKVYEGRSWMKPYLDLIEYRPNTVMELDINGVSLGETVVLSERGTGRTFTMFLSEFQKCLDHLTIDQNAFYGQFIVIERSKTYSLSLVTGTEDDCFDMETVEQLRQGIIQ